MIREERPSVDGPRSRLGESSEAPDNLVPVGVVAEDGCPFDSPHHHMVQGVRRIEAGLARHGISDAYHPECPEAGSPIRFKSLLEIGCYSPLRIRMAPLKGSVASDISDGARGTPRHDGRRADPFGESQGCTLRRFSPADR